MIPKAQKPPTPTEIAQQHQQAQDRALKAEQEARTGDNRLSIGDRAKKWDEAIHAYEEVQRQNPNSDAEIDAKIHIARIHEERAASDARNTGDYDVAERLYKDLERQYPKRTATVTIGGRQTPVAVDQYAHDHLQQVLSERDQRQRHHPLYQLLDFFVRLTGRMPGFSYWFALVLITVIIKAILYPLSKRQFKYMADMQRIAPMMKEVQEKLKGRPADEINRKVMALYKEQGVNPASGCLPMISQMAVLYPLYWMVRLYEYQFRQGYFLWIGSGLSHQYPQWLATSLAVADVPLLILYAISLVMTSRLQPMATDPQQAQTQKMMTYGMPIMFSFMSWKMAWPAAFTFYWLVMNAVSTWQQWRILKTVNVPAVPGSSSGGSRPEPPQSGGPSSGGTQTRPQQGGNSGNGRNGRSDLKPGEAKRGGSRKSGRR